jgi:endonuclease/exonuclease/phosphatase family metal-dependent hydrolase
MRTLRTWSLLAALLAAPLAAGTTRRPAPSSPSSSRTRTLRVMSYNIHVGIGVDKRLDLRRVAEVIRRERPDLVGLQEIDRGTQRTGRVDQIAELARLTGMHYAFAPNLNFQGGWYGVAILSRFPLLASEHARFRHRREAERRGYLLAEVEINGRPLSFVTTHLDHQQDDNRLFETEQLLRAVPDSPAPLVVAGDFNDEPAGESYRLMLTRFADAWAAGGAAGDGGGLTYPADKPRKRIDYIFHAPRERTRARRAWVVESPASDHRALVAEIELKLD